MKNILALVLMFAAVEAKAALPMVGAAPGQRYIVSGSSIVAIGGSFSGSVTASCMTVTGANGMRVTKGRTLLQADSEPYTLEIGRDDNAGTGFYLGNPDTSATPNLVFSNNAGTARVTFTDGGSVGIGTASPGSTSTLHVAGGASVTGGLSVGTVTNDTKFDVKGAAVTPHSGLDAANAIMSVYGAGQLGIGSDGASPFGMWMQTFDHTGTSPAAYPILLNPALGSVGVGTNAPATTLDVNGNAQFGSGATKSTFTATGNLYIHSASSISLTGAAPTARLDTGSYERIQNACGAGQITCTATCSAGKQATGCGCYTDQPLVRASAGTDTSCTCQTTVVSTALMTAMAICLNIK